MGSRDYGASKQEILAYLEDHPDAAPVEVINATGLNPNTVRWWMRDFRKEPAETRLADMPRAEFLAALDVSLAERKIPRW